MHVTNDEDRGLYEKFIVQRSDGSSGPGGKHEGCEYFVLDLTHDPYALAALAAYRDACKRLFPMLADDLNSKINEIIVNSACKNAQ